jgi:endo-1,4-beta-xylanase
VRWRRPILLVAAVGLLALTPGPAGAAGRTEKLAPPLRRLAARHGLAFGAAVRATALQTDADYAMVLGHQYGAVTAENEMKWAIVHPQPDVYDFRAADVIVSFAGRHHMAIRGHTLVWHNQNPEWLLRGHFGREQLIAILRDHIRAVVGRYRGRVSQWDVVNEAVDDSGGLRHNVWLDGIGPDYIALAFRFAHEADPSAALFYNDYLIERRGPKAKAVKRLVRHLLAWHVPIRGVGFQLHTLPSLFSAPDLAHKMAYFRQLGLDVAITEHDVWLAPPFDQTARQAQARVYRASLATCLAARNCHTYVTWGFTDRYSWVPATFPPFGEALPFDADLRPKPAAYALHEALAHD